MLDWQSIAVAFIISGALIYVARRGLARLRSMRASRADGAPACATGCGKCGDEGMTTQPARIVQIGRRPRT